MTQTISLPIASETSDAFARRLAEDGQRVERVRVETLQLNLGKMCNLACHHCHVEAGPKRTEIMPEAVMDRILAWIDRHGEAVGLESVDLTGGAPEMNPGFRKLVVALRERGLHVIDRCNLTILLEPGYESLAAFMAEHEVEIVASLPCYLEENVDGQRGQGVFGGSIEALKRLNAVGYGGGGERAGAGAGAGAPCLDLIYNPTGYGLPGDQRALEADYKKHLGERYGIVFDRLLTITNMPIKRFAHALRRDGAYEDYLALLRSAHRPQNVEGVMCRSLVSVGWLGGVYDCDFNQMMQMALVPDRFGPEHDEHEVEEAAKKLWEYEPAALLERPVRTGEHCFGCTAGSGSSCTGALGA